MEATASATGCSRSDAYSDTISSSKVAKPGWSATLNASAAMPPRRASSICTSRGSMPAAASAGRSDVVEGAGVGLARPGQREQRADEHVAADAAGTVQVQDHGRHSTASSRLRHRLCPDRRVPDTGCAPPIGTSARGCMRPVAVVPVLYNAAMRIAQLAPPWITVPPAGYGGTEWVVQQLCDGLVASGHDVRLYATGDSHTAAELCALFPEQMPDGIGVTPYDARQVSFAFADIEAERVRPRARPLRVPRRRLQPLPGDADGPHRPLRLRRHRLRLLRAVRPGGRLHRHQRVPALAWRRPA